MIKPTTFGQTSGLLFNKLLNTSDRLDTLQQFLNAKLFPWSIPF
ncbi:hypothetical protein [Calothrix sp. NIES-3974]|nr:hypothetical protein [Calothrix sp. NIES-3974]